MRILTDIGGTHIRFACEENCTPINIQKYNAADFCDLDAALTKYCADQTITEINDILIATAGAELNGRWSITNNPDFSIYSKNWKIALTLNDFEAGTYALPTLKPVDLKTLKTGNAQNNALCLIGAGTGLGLGYYRDGNIQKTHGGHIPIASLNDAHGKAIKEIRTHINCAIVFEDIVSGPGLQKLRDIYDQQKASDLFHDFLGIFAATALVTGDAYGGLYLTGGVTNALMENNTFDFDRFNNALCFDAVPCVKNDIVNTPIYYIADPYPALKGLIHAQSISDN